MDRPTLEEINKESFEHAIKVFNKTKTACVVIFGEDENGKISIIAGVDVGAKEIAQVVGKGLQKLYDALKTPGQK